jgi:hypothetical protein
VHCAKHLNAHHFTIDISRSAELNVLKEERNALTARQKATSQAGKAMVSDIAAATAGRLIYSRC